MKIIKKLPGSFSSEVFLVKIDKKEYVLKRGNNASEILSEQEFFIYILQFFSQYSCL